jgi:hypothetical protein
MLQSIDLCSMKVLTVVRMPEPLAQLPQCTLRGL